MHEHNTGVHDFARDYAFAQDAKPEDILPLEQQATFQGIRRANGKVGTRNYIGVLTSVNCSATVAGFIAEEVKRSGMLDDYPNIDGIVALKMDNGCVIDYRGAIFDILKRTAWGYATNPNMGGVLMVGLGCEGFQIPRFKEAYNVVENDTFRTMTIQETGGTTKTVAAGVAAIREMLPHVNNVKRETCHASELILALQCGGSDGYSGITANPALGAAVDILVQARRHRHPVRNAGDLWRRASAHPPRREPRGGREARRHHQVVGGLHQPQQHGDEQQPLSRQQAGRPHHHSREVAGRGGQGRHDHAPPRLPLCRAGHRQGLRLHGHAGL